MTIELIRSILGTVIRRLLTGIFAWLAADGWITAQDAESLIIWITATLAVLAWSLYEKWKTQKALEKALQLPAGTSIEQLKEELREQ